VENKLGLNNRLIITLKWEKILAIQGVQLKKAQLCRCSTETQILRKRLTLNSTINNLVHLSRLILCTPQPEEASDRWSQVLYSNALIDKSALYRRGYRLAISGWPRKDTNAQEDYSHRITAGFKPHHNSTIVMRSGQSD